MTEKCPKCIYWTGHCLIEKEGSNCNEFSINGQYPMGRRTMTRKERERLSKGDDKRPWVIPHV